MIAWIPQPEYYLPLIFAVLMGVAILVYVILDGYDLGIGILLPWGQGDDKDRMVASIAPFWDANETWLVLGIGLLLVAFPKAHGTILTALYLPTTVMLLGLILRGVAFDFRVKVAAQHKKIWDCGFTIGSLITALAQGYMLGRYIFAFDSGWLAHLFASLTSVCLATGYAFIGSCWLIIKCEHALQRQAIAWARVLLKLTALSIVLISIVTPWIHPHIFSKWFTMPNLMLLGPIPVITALCFIALHHLLKRMPWPNDAGCHLPFIGACVIFCLCFQGLAFSFYPDLILTKMTLWQGANSVEALQVMLIGVVVVLPCIMAYTALAYRLFRGKATTISYL